MAIALHCALAGVVCKLLLGISLTLSVFVFLYLAVRTLNHPESFLF